MTETSTLLPLNPQTVAELWSKTYNHDGQPDWSHIFQYYHQDIIFQDSIQRVEGKAAFLEMCNRLTNRCQSLHMELLHILQQDNIIIMEWIMTMSFKKSPDTPLYGCTRLTIGEDGLIMEQRDYYDLWGDIFNNIPRFNKFYRKNLRKYFG